jgi:hypothetical protein
MSDTDRELVNSAVNDLLKRDPSLVTGATQHLARLAATPVESPRKMTPEEVRAEIERLSGRGPLTDAERRDIDREGELARKAEEYRQVVAKREEAEATARAREIFRSCQPQPEKA